MNRPPSLRATLPRFLLPAALLACACGPKSTSGGTGGDHGAAGDVQSALQPDRVADVAGVALTAIGLDIRADLIEFRTQCRDIGVAEMGILGNVGDGHFVLTYGFVTYVSVGYASGGCPAIRG